MIKVGGGPISRCFFSSGRLFEIVVCEREREIEREREREGIRAPSDETR